MCVCVCVLVLKGHVGLHRTVNFSFFSFSGWVCFRIVVLEKTLENPLDCKEIKPVNPKENQP